MPEIRIDAEVYCSCGAGLCNQTTVESSHFHSSRGVVGTIVVEPCKKCLQELFNDGFSEGRKEGDHGH